MDTLIEIKNLKKYFPIRDGKIFSKHKLNKAVDDVTITIKKNEVIGLVGESGCGKPPATSRQDASAYALSLCFEYSSITVHSMVVADLDIESVAIYEPKADPPLVID